MTKVKSETEYNTLLHIAHLGVPTDMWNHLQTRSYSPRVAYVN